MDIIKSKNLKKKLIILLFSIFLAFMTVKISIEDYYSRSVVILLIFMAIFYYWITPQLFKLNSYLLESFNKIFKLKMDSYFNKSLSNSWFGMSIITGISSLMLVILSGYYTYLCEKFSGTPRYWDYSYMVGILPDKIFIFIIMGILIYFCIGIYYFLKEGTNKIFIKIITLILNVLILWISIIIILNIAIFLHSMLAAMFGV